jgi:hypothetical protein
MRFETLIAVSIKAPLIWAVMRCSLVDTWQRFGESCVFHLPGRKNFIRWSWEGTFVVWEVPLSNIERITGTFFVLRDSPTSLQANAGIIGYLLTVLGPSWEDADCAATQDIPSNFKEPEGSTPCSQEPSTGPYPEPDCSSPYYPILSLLRSILILSTHLRLGLPSDLFPFGSPTNILYALGLYDTLNYTSSFQILSNSIFTHHAAVQPVGGSERQRVMDRTRKEDFTRAVVQR